MDYEQRQLQRSARREMKRLEAELPLWQALTDSITGTHAQDFDNQTLAVLRYAFSSSVNFTILRIFRNVQDYSRLKMRYCFRFRGRLVRYLMRSKEISLGRSSRDVTVDIDFSLEGAAFKVVTRSSKGFYIPIPCFV